MVRSAYAQRSNDDDFTQPGILVREVFNDERRTKLVDQVAGSLLGGVREPVLRNAFAYWTSTDAAAGGRIETKVSAGAEPHAPEALVERCALHRRTAACTTAQPRPRRPPPRPRPPWPGPRSL